MSESPTDDVSLTEALAGGDAEAARELYRRHCHPILRFALAMTDCRAASASPPASASISDTSSVGDSLMRGG